MLVVDRINHVNLANGLVRIEVVQATAAGERRSVEEIAIPATEYGRVVAALQQAGEQLRQQIETAREQQESGG